MSGEHAAVLLREAVDALLESPAGFYVDGTFGRGGHSREILERLDADGRLLAVDKDAAAETEARRLAASDSRFCFHRGSFAELPQVVAARGCPPASGILLDLGVSSPQLDAAHRGFSFQQDGPLDMRMDQRSGESAAQWLSRADESEIARVLRDYGEERYARRIAAAIIHERQQEPLTTTAQLAAVVSAAHPRWEKHRHPATRTFQALRILVNRELDDLRDFLDGVLDLLAIGGRLVVISFHSLEDRMVKRFFRDAARGERLPRELPLRAVEASARLRLLGRARRPGDEEISGNPRSRSAVMRCAERLA